MRMQEYKRAIKRGPVRGKLVVRVWHHKTVVAHSCAEVVIGPAIQGMLALYVHHLRPTTDCPNLLVQQSGRALLSKHLSRELQRLGEQLGITLPSATYLRKATKQPGKAGAP